MNSKITKAILIGFFASILLLIFNVAVVSLLSGFAFAFEQFTRYWYYIIALSVGFGVQVGLYSFLRQEVKEKASGKVLAATGATSTLAMISCCAHYLVNILPIVGISGFVAVIAQFQIQLFWVGIIFNIAGIIFIISRIKKFSKGA